MQQAIDTGLEVIIEKLPPHIARALLNQAEKRDLKELLEVILDLGREPEARFLKESVVLSRQEVTEEEIQYVVQRISPFGGDNRAGIERTLHRISAIRNRNQKVVGLTIRVGRAIFGTIKIIEDLVLTGQSILLLGRPGVGKTTILREVARVLSDDAKKRVVIVDTSNEIAGDGDIPHPGIGRARRMQVPSPAAQHGVMIEAVENHMPEVIVIDEIGTELEAGAARTIAERGVQLVATAHGNTLENLVQNPTLSDLVGGVQSVTLGDVEARRRRTQKTVLERKAPPTFDILVEIQGWNQVAIHPDVADTVDRLLRGYPVTMEMRTVDAEGRMHRTHVARDATLVTFNGGGGRRNAPRDGQSMPRSFDRHEERVTSRGPFRSAMAESEQPETEEDEAEWVEDENETFETEDLSARHSGKVVKILPYGVNKGKLQQSIKAMNAPIELVGDMKSADLLLTTKNFYRRRTQALQEAENGGKPVYVLRKNTTPQIHQFFRAITRNSGAHNDGERGDVDTAIREAEDAIDRMERSRDHKAELTPQASYIRRLQHQLAEEHGMVSTSAGRESNRHVVIYKK